MKKFLSTLFIALGLVAGSAHASASASTFAPVVGTNYTVLKPPLSVDQLVGNLPVSKGPVGKVTVTEFFWYGCPHCYEFNPTLEAWVKKQSAHIVFNRVPVAFQDNFKPHSQMFYALVALGLENQLTPKVFHEIHENHNYLMTEDDQIKFFSKLGVDPKKYKDAYESFGTATAVTKAAEFLQQAGINGVPTLIIQGKYETSPAQADQGIEKTMQVLDYLVAQILAKKL